MTRLSKLAACVISVAAIASAAWARDPDYVSIPMEITVNKPAAEVWAKIGGWCVNGKWLYASNSIPCEVTSGNGEMGSVRVVAGRVTEVLVAKTELSYGYAQPAVEGKFYNLYHGFLEARPIDAKSTKVIYTLMLDMSDQAEQVAKDAMVAGRRKSIEGALANAKKAIEG